VIVKWWIAYAGICLLFLRFELFFKKGFCSPDDFIEDVLREMVSSLFVAKGLPGIFAYIGSIEKFIFCNQSPNLSAGQA